MGMRMVVGEAGEGGRNTEWAVDRDTPPRPPKVPFQATESGA